jgi:hypothetical protein
VEEAATWHCDVIGPAIQTTQGCAGPRLDMLPSSASTESRTASFRHAEPCAQPHITPTLAVQQSNFADDLGGQLPLPLPSPNRGERAKANRPSGVRDASCTAPFGAMRCSTALYRAYVVLTLRRV